MARVVGPTKSFHYLSLVSYKVQPCLAEISKPELWKDSKAESFLDWLGTAIDGTNVGRTWQEKPGTRLSFEVYLGIFLCIYNCC